MPLDRGPRVNERITIRQVRLIDAEGNQQGVVATDQGMIEGCAAELLRARATLDRRIAILADVRVKHGLPLHERKNGNLVDITRLHPLCRQL